MNAVMYPLVKRQIFGAGLHTNHYMVQRGDGVLEFGKAIGKAIRNVFEKSGLKDSIKSVARQTFQSGKDAVKNYIRENKDDLLDLAKNVGKAGIDIATEEGAKAFGEIIEGKNVKEVVKKRGERTLKRGAKKAVEISKPELATQRRRATDMLRQERIRAYQQAQQEAKNVESKVVEAINEEQNEIRREVSEKSKQFLKRLGLSPQEGNGLTQLGLSKKGKGLRQLGTGAHTNKKRGRPRKNKK